MTTPRLDLTSSSPHAIDSIARCYTFPHHSASLSEITIDSTASLHRGPNMVRVSPNDSPLIATGDKPRLWTSEPHHLQKGKHGLSTPFLVSLGQVTDEQRHDLSPVPEGAAMPACPRTKPVRTIDDTESTDSDASSTKTTRVAFDRYNLGSDSFVHAFKATREAQQQISPLSNGKCLLAYRTSDAFQEKDSLLDLPRISPQAAERTPFGEIQ